MAPSGTRSSTQRCSSPGPAKTARLERVERASPDEQRVHEEDGDESADTRRLRRAAPERDDQQCDEKERDDGADDRGAGDLLDRRGERRAGRAEELRRRSRDRAARYGKTNARPRAKTSPHANGSAGPRRAGGDPPDEHDEPERDDVEEVAVVQPVDLEPGVVLGRDDDRGHRQGRRVERREGRDERGVPLRPLTRSREERPRGRRARRRRGRPRGRARAPAACWTSHLATIATSYVRRRSSYSPRDSAGVEPRRIGPSDEQQHAEHERRAGGPEQAEPTPPARAALREEPLREDERGEERGVEGEELRVGREWRRRSRRAPRPAAAPSAARAPARAPATPTRR